MTTSPSPDTRLLDATTHALQLLEAANDALTDAETATLWTAQAQRNLRDRADGKLG